MGSLVAGWNSHAQHDPKPGIYKRNKSLTKDEIEAYWRSKKRIEEEHLKAIIRSCPIEIQDTRPKRIAKATLQRSSTFPMTEKSRYLLNLELPGLEDLTKKKSWWTRCYSAFLNEPFPATMDEPSNRQA